MENKEELYEIDINESINNENTIETETNSNNINNSNETTNEDKIDENNNEENTKEDTKEDTEEIVVENKDKKVKKKKPFYKRWYFITVIVIVGITILFNCYYTVVIVSGDSMYPSFQDGNIMLAKRRYDIWRFDVVTIASKQRGDILIKRVIGLPYETIEFKDNKLYVNGEYRTDPYAYGNTEDFKITLGENEYFCLGDNRENSLDSRAYGPFSSNEIFAKIDYKQYPSNNDEANNFINQ